MSLSVAGMANIAVQLEQTGYIVLAHPLTEDLSAKLFTRCHDDEQADFQVAHVGRGADKQQISSLRGDSICWLNDVNSTDHAYLDWMEELRVGLNAALYLGLFDYECHYAIYGAGAGYARHLDALVGKRNRILSTVLYLNEDWQSGDGGELVVYQPEGAAALVTVQPRFGTMIIFLSETFPHEVLISHHTRRSIAGWFRVSGS